MSNENQPDWQDIVEDAQKVQNMRLQNEQTDLLRQIASGTSQADLGEQRIAKVRASMGKKLGVSWDDDPIEFERRRKALMRKQFLLAFVFICIGLVILLVTQANT
jgi:hypothetical protein